jgi:DNA polymerase I
LTQQQDFGPDRRKRLDDMPEPPEDVPLLLLSSVYSGEEKKVYLKFYDSESNSIYFWRDREDHQPYCYTKLEHETAMKEIIEKEPKYTMKRQTRRDVIADEDIEVVKIIAPDPLSIGGNENSIRERKIFPCWEADIKYHENYLYDLKLIAGAYYKRIGNTIERFDRQISEKVNSMLTNLLWDKIRETGEEGKDYREYIRNWALLLNQPIPQLKRVALDIEVESEEGKMPNPRDHDRRVTAVAFAGSDGFRRVLVLTDNIDSDGTDFISEAEQCRTEKELILKAFDIINTYPILLTFNGDDFDLPYLYARSQDPTIDPSNGVVIPKSRVPIVVKRDSFIRRGAQAEPVSIRHGIHLDLFRTFQNRSIQIYAFSRLYTDYSLNSISDALLHETKMEFDGEIGDLPVQKLAEYCLKDADLTLRLSTFNDNLLIKLLVVISRIGRLPIDDVSRFGVNQWIRGILYYEHRLRNELIPNREELEKKGKASTTAIIKEKKYRGGLVVEPTPGIHFNVVVLDFASLYPSIIKVHNLSYETINCVHHECEATGRIEGTEHWICRKRKGLASLLIGSLRDLRVSYYKHLSKDKTIPVEERQLYNVVSQAIKVILNASYGVMGAEIFPLYCLPVAEVTAAIGRDTIKRTIDKCVELGIQVVYGDTDSLFLKNPTPTGIEEVSIWAKNELGVDLEMDKEYRYVAFSDLKKNYIGVLKDGTVEVKGLTGKKSHTPPFIRKAFRETLDILGNVNSEHDFASAKEKIRNIVRNSTRSLEAHQIPLADLVFNVMIGKAPKDYGRKIGTSQKLDDKSGRVPEHRMLPQHIKAARLLPNWESIRGGHIISFVKTKGSDGVKPLDIAKPEDIDNEKYIEAMESTFDQILSALNVDFRQAAEQPHQKRIDELFWNNQTS